MNDYKRYNRVSATMQEFFVGYADVVFTDNFRQSLNGGFDDPTPKRCSNLHVSMTRSAAAAARTAAAYTFPFSRRRSPRNTFRNDLVTQLHHRAALIFYVTSVSDFDND